MQIVTFFRWQERVLGVLMGWGAANVVIGAGTRRARGDAVRHIAWQAITWGAIDLVLAVMGRRGARKKSRGATPESTQQALAGFRRVLAVNAVLDIGYILGGSFLAATAHLDRRRFGAGIGILVQGIFLAAYDALLLRRAARWHDTA